MSSNRTIDERLSSVRSRVQTLIQTAKSNPGFVSELRSLGEDAFAEYVNSGGQNDEKSQEFWQTFAAAGRGLVGLTVALDEDDLSGNTDCKTGTCELLEEIVNLSNQVRSLEGASVAKRTSRAKKAGGAKKASGAKKSSGGKKSGAAKKAGGAKKTSGSKKGSESRTR